VAWIIKVMRNAEARFALSFLRESRSC